MLGIGAHLYGVAVPKLTGPGEHVLCHLIGGDVCRECLGQGLQHWQRQPVLLPDVLLAHTNLNAPIELEIVMQAAYLLRFPVGKAFGPTCRASNMASCAGTPSSNEICSSVALSPVASAIRLCEICVFDTEIGCSIWTRMPFKCSPVVNLGGSEDQNGANSDSLSWRSIMVYTRSNRSLSMPRAANAWPCI